MNPKALAVIPFLLIFVVLIAWLPDSIPMLGAMETRRPWDRDAAEKDCAAWAKANDAEPKTEADSEAD